MSEEASESSRRRIRFLRFLCSYLTAVILMGQGYRYPGALKDLVSQSLTPPARLEYPWLYLVFAPFCQIADHLSILSLRQHFAFLAFAIALWLVYRAFVLRRDALRPRPLAWESVKLLLFNAGYALLFAVIVLVPRPMARIALDDSDLIAVDMHSHTNHSWDGAKWFTPERNLRWHRDAGFHAAFITDHNLVEGAQAAFREQPVPGIVALRGEEVSLFESHWAVLGNRTLIPNTPYNTGYEGIERFLRDMSRSTSVAVIASLPEYWKYHWGAGLKDFVRWGVHGFELANSAPIALDFHPALQAEMRDFCEANRLAMTGITDTHGWGFTVYVWNVLRLPGWRKMDPEALESAIVRSVRQAQPIHVIARIRSGPPAGTAHLALDPLLQIWETARSLPASQAAACLVWLWTAYAISRRKGSVAMKKSII